MLLATTSGRRLLGLRLNGGPVVGGQRLRWPLPSHSPLAAAGLNTWPDPVTQQTIHEFLHEINYFQRPNTFLNVGLKHKPVVASELASKQHQHRAPPKPNPSQPVTSDQSLDDILEVLSQESTVPQLDHDDLLLTGERVVGLATAQGIYRDLFGSYSVNRADIAFTQAQAERLDKFVPHYWITDQPFARVVRHPKQPEPVKFFVPLVRVSARFVHQPSNSPTETDEHLYAHTSYYGNHIPASDALRKPSVALDCRLLSAHLTGRPLDEASIKQEKHFDNWTPGLLQVLNLSQHSKLFYSLLLLNLDYLHTGDNCNLHWMAANIKASPQDNAQYDELCDYLPVHGIRGFGYSRYVFVLLQHEAPITSPKIDSFSLEARKFNLNSFIQEHQSKNIVPVGLSWFQTTWDETSNSVFHDYVDIKAPVYEHVQPVEAQRPETAYPGRIPFNIYLDHYRHKKDINQQVLLERLKQVDPFDYKDQYEVPKVPPTIHQDEEMPSWMRAVMFKKKNKIGYWRGLRPASATLPHNNNADLDYPLRPIESSEKKPPEFPNEYQGRPRKKLHKDMPISKPVNEFNEVFIQDDHEIHLEKVREMLETAKLKRQQQSHDNNNNNNPKTPS